MNVVSPVITVDHVSKRFGSVCALDGVSLDVLPGELHAIVGENGAGKSTLMKILAGVITDYEGRVLVRGQAVAWTGTRAAERAGVSIIHQELNLVDNLSVAANIFLGREPHNRWGWLDDTAIERESARLLEELDCRLPADRLVRELRVGDQQLVEIAKALSLSAEILIMDEPTSALSETEVARLDQVIARLRQRGVTILYISHKMDEVFRLADRISVLRDGRLVKTTPRASTTPREVTHLMVGRQIEQASHFAPRQPGAVVLEVEQLSLPWAGHVRRWRLHDVTFQLRRGEIVGIAGLMGAGRTELLECLFGASLEPSTGQMRLGGQVVRFRHPAEACRAGIALVTEDRKRLGLFSELNVAQNITLCTLRELARWGLVRPSNEQRQAQQMVDRLGVRTEGLSAPITSLSGGNQQKAIIGRWLLTRPRVLLLDDPTRGIDVGAKAELYVLMDQLCREGLAILLTSSELPELLTLCDRILVLSEGNLTAEFTRGQFSEQQIIEAATATPASTPTAPSAVSATQ